MSIVISEGSGDVGYVRALLTQAGRQQINIREKDQLPVFGVNTIYTDYADVFDVAGVWLINDPFGSGTNYVTSGATVYPEYQKIVLSGSLPADTEEVLVTYVSRDGLSDNQVQINIDMAKDWLTMEMFEASINWSGTSVYEGLAKSTMRSVATYYSLLAMNNGNVIQAGFNYRFAEYEIQTKLWGEGMSTESLLLSLWERSMNMIKALKYYQKYPEVGIYVIKKGTQKTVWNKDTTIFDSEIMSADRYRSYDSKSMSLILRIDG